SNAGLWRRQLEAAGREHSALAPDLPGHGRSSGIEGLPTVEAYADCVLAFARALRLRRCVLVGRSMGGAVGLTLAARHPELVDGLVPAGTAVVGAYEHPTRFAPDKTAFQLHAESARGALEDAGLAIKDVDGFFTSGVGPIGILSLAGHLNLRPSYVDSQAIGGSSFVSHCLHAAAAIDTGLCRVALVTYGSTAASERFAIGTGAGGFVLEPPDNFEAPFGPTIVGSYALVAQRHMHEYGTTSEQLAEIAVTMRRHAGWNPQAKYRDPITVEDVLASRVISS